MNHNKCIILLKTFRMGEMGVGYMGVFCAIFSSRFFCKSKTVLKNKVYLKNAGEIEANSTNIAYLFQKQDKKNVLQVNEKHEQAIRKINAKDINKPAIHKKKLKCYIKLHKDEIHRVV